MRLGGTNVHDCGGVDVLRLTERHGGSRIRSEAGQPVDHYIIVNHEIIGKYLFTHSHTVYDTITMLYTFYNAPGMARRERK